MICDCNLKWFLELVQSELSQVQLAASCSSPDFEKRHIKTLSEEDLQCGEISLCFYLVGNKVKGMGTKTPHYTNDNYHIAVKKFDKYQ